MGPPLHDALWLRLSVLMEKILGGYSGFLQSWYSDDFSMTGAGAHLKPDISCIEALGTARGLFLKTEK